MKETRLKKILVGLDGSDRAIAAVKYISNISPLKKCEVLLLNVFDEVPQAYRELGQQHHYRSKVAEVMMWEMQHKLELEKQANAAKQILVNKGFSEKAVTMKFKKREEGIALDIINEATEEYDVVAVGRRGISQLREMVLGSVSSRLMEKLHSMPFMMIGKDATPGKVIIGFDGSENAMRAVRFAATALHETGFQVKLVYVVRGDDKELSEVVETGLEKQFETAKGILSDYGFAAESIGTEILYGEKSRAGAIVREARSGNYGTIVLGRRGISKIEEFFMGRVTNKVAYMAKGLALWVVN